MIIWPETTISVYDTHVLCLVIFDIDDAVKYEFDDGYGYHSRFKPGDKVMLTLQCPREDKEMIDFVNTDVNHSSVGVVIEEVGKEYSGQVSAKRL